MRQGQPGKRGRGRGRKSQNPMGRSYESSGPDVKIRGTAAHIADKYQNLARDAHSSGDIVTAENYYQHAEHYLRIIAAAQAQMAPQAPQPGADGNGGGASQPRSAGPEDDNSDQSGRERANGPLRRGRGRRRPDPKDARNANNEKPDQTPAPDAPEDAKDKSASTEDDTKSGEAVA